MKLLSSPHSKIKSERRKLENDEFSHFKENVSTVLLLSTRFITLRILLTNHCDRMWQREEDQFQMSQNESKEVDLTVKLKRVQFNKKTIGARTNDCATLLPYLRTTKTTTEKSANESIICNCADNQVTCFYGRLILSLSL